MIEHKLIICSVKNLKRVTEKFPTKRIVINIYCDNEFAVYIRKYPRGVFAIKVDDWSIWKPDIFPYFKKWRG